MTDNQENKYNMYESTLAVLKANNTVWSPIAPIGETITSIEAKMKLVRDYRQVQEKDTTGITINKHNIESNLVDAMIKVISGLIAHATVTENPELLNSINYNRNNLQRSRDNILYDKAQLIFNTATPLATELATYLVTQPDIDAINTLSSDYLTAIPAKRAAVSASKTSTANIKNTFKELDNLFKGKLDNLLILFQVPNSTFYNEYKAARTIIDLGVRHETEKTLISGTVENFETEFPINEAYVWIVEKGISYTTGPDGAFTLDVGQAGTYTVKVEKPGYITYTEDPVTIAKNDEITLDIQLEPKQ
ncbi:MAG: hypothetical protein DRJ05_04430 [Bacteroidetes bacterium]|nr:MAG: hypothetical protein DRJ05_04430 [Bacteroidota bacterium]